MLYISHVSCSIPATTRGTPLVKLLFLILFLNRAPLRSKVTPAAPPEFLRPFSISSAPGNHSRTEPKRIRRHRAGEPEMLLALPVVLLAGAGAFLLFKFATVVDGTPCLLPFQSPCFVPFYPAFSLGGLNPSHLSVPGCAAGDLTLVSRGPPRRERVEGKVGPGLLLARAYFRFVTRAGN
jgi:hypothetical protein